MNEREQEELLTGSFDWIKGVAGEKRIESLIWYNIRDSARQGTHWAEYCGLMSYGGSFRPAWTAFQNETGVPHVIPQAPSVQTSAATGVGSNAATLNGTVNPGNLPTTYHFEYGTTTSYGYSIPVPDGDSGAGGSAVPQSANLLSLESGTTYHFRIVATNFLGTSSGSDATLTTLGAPRVASIIDPERGLTTAWRGTDGNLYETVAAGGKWTTFSPTFGQLPTGVNVASSPALATDKANGLVALWRGSDGNIYETYAVNGNWTTFSPTWSNKPAGVTATGSPAAVYDGTNGLTIEWRGSDGNIYETLAPGGGSWTTFSPTWSNKPAGVTAASDPAAVDDPVNGLTIEWLGSDGNIYETLAPGGGNWTTFSPTWSNKPAGVTARDNPTVAYDAADGVTIEWRGSDGNIYETLAPGGGSWTTFSPTWSNKPAGVTATGSPAAVYDGANGLTIEWRGSDGNIYETLAPGGGNWTTFSPTWEGKPSGVTVTRAPSVVDDPSNGVTISWRGSDGQLYQTAAPGGGKWSTFSPTFGRLGGVSAAGRPAAAVDSSGNLKVAWRATDGNLFETYPTGGYWSSVPTTAFSLPTGTTIVGEPAMIKDSANGVVAVARGSDGNLYEAQLSSGKWTTFSPTWEGKPAGVSVTGTPALAMTPTSGLTLSWRGSDGNLYVTRAVSGKWGTFNPTGGNMPAGITVQGSPSAVYDSSNGLSISWRGSDGNVYETLAPGGKWTTFSPTWSNKPSGVTVASDPAAALDPTNGTSIVWRGSNNHLYLTRAPGGGSWTTIEESSGDPSSGATVTGNPATIIDPANGLVSAWRGSNGNIFETLVSGGKWTTFSPTWEGKPAGVTVASDPALAITSSGIAFFWRGTNANIEETVSQGGKWTTFAPTWGAVFGKVALGE